MNRDGQPFHITGTSDDGAVTAIPCVLRRIVVNKPVDTKTITISDGSTPIAVITCSGAVPFFVDYDARIKTSLDVTVNASIDATVIWD